MKPNIRLLALDLDGTLLNEEKHITPRTLAALERAREQGVLLVPVTGRPAQGLPQAVLDLPGLRYAVTSNGATIRDLQEDRFLLEKHLTPATCLAVLARCADFDMIRQVFREGVGYLSQTDYDTLKARYAGTAMLAYHLSTRKILPGTVEEFLTQDERPVEELFFLTDSTDTKARLRAALPRQKALPRPSLRRDCPSLRHRPGGDAVPLSRHHTDGHRADPRGLPCPLLHGHPRTRARHHPHPGRPAGRGHPQRPALLPPW